MEVNLRCQRCGYEWTYRGKNKYYATCPHCLTKVKVVKHEYRNDTIGEITMGKSKSIKFGDGDSSGIQITYIKSRDTLEFFGWYDHYVGIEPHEIAFDEFKKQLGIA